MRYNKEMHCADSCITKPAPAVQAIELDSADETIALQMTRWLSHLRAERRLSPKTLEAYARDVRQWLEFLSEQWGSRVTLARFAALEASDVRACRARRRGSDNGACPRCAAARWRLVPRHGCGRPRQ